MRDYDTLKAVVVNGQDLPVVRMAGPKSAFVVAPDGFQWPKKVRHEEYPSTMRLVSGGTLHRVPLSGMVLKRHG